MTKPSRVAGYVAMAIVLLAAGAVAAQTTDRDALRRQVERRFDLLPLHDGIALHPKSPRSGVRSIELTGDTISIDGVPATGPELRDKLGADADLVLRLSYLDPDARRALAEPAAPPAEVSPPPRPPAPPQPEVPSPPRPRHRSDDRVRIGGRVNVDADESVNDVVVIGGSARIDGEVRGDLVVVGGTLDIGPAANIHRDVSVVGGVLHRDPAARIGGRVSEVGPGISLHGWRFNHFAPMVMWGTMWGGVFSLMSTLMRFCVLCVLASLVLLVAGDYVERVGERAAAEPVKAGVVGILAQILCIPILIVLVLFLVVTIIGIPLLVLVPFAILAVIVFAVVGFTAVAQHVGRLVSTRLGSTPPNTYLTAIIGIIVVMSPVLLGRVVGLGDGIVFPITAALLFVGFLVEYIAWTVGFGAVALNRFDRRQAQPPPTPA